MNGLKEQTSAHILTEIRDFADRAHGEQMRKYTPERYIVHPERVMKHCAEYTDDISMLSAALLHDVLEDTPVTREEIYDFLASRISPQQASKAVHLVEELTDVFIKKDYPQLNRRQRKSKEMDRIARTGGESQTIKYADIIDNCREIIQHDRSFAGIFLYECRDILKRINKGNKQLYNKAVETIDACILELQQLKRG